MARAHWHRSGTGIELVDHGRHSSRRHRVMIPTQPSGATLHTTIETVNGQTTAAFAVVQSGVHSCVVAPISARVENLQQSRPILGRFKYADSTHLVTKRKLRHVYESLTHGLRSLRFRRHGAGSSNCSKYCCARHQDPRRCPSCPAPICAGTPWTYARPQQLLTTLVNGLRILQAATIYASPSRTPTKPRTPTQMHGYTLVSCVGVRCLPSGTFIAGDGTTTANLVPFRLDPKAFIGAVASTASFTSRCLISLRSLRSTPASAQIAMSRLASPNPSSVVCVLQSSDVKKTTLVLGCQLYVRQLCADLLAAVPPRVGQQPSCPAQRIFPYNLPPSMEPIRLKRMLELDVDPFQVATLLQY